MILIKTIERANSKGVVEQIEQRMDFGKGGDALAESLLASDPRFRKAEKAEGKPEPKAEKKAEKAEGGDK